MRSDGAPTLREMQERFYDLVTAPESVATTLAQRGESPADLERIAVSTSGFSALERLELYANMYFYRILDVLRGDYPTVVACIGDAAFHNLATDYLVACRPAHPSLRNAGDRLPRFLREHPLGLERAGLSDLAALERRRTEVFDARDADVWTIERLRALGPDQLAALPIRLVPAHALLLVEHSVEEVWQAVEDGRPVPELEARPGTLVVWRNEPFVYQRRFDDAERSLTPLIDQGTTFGVVCELLAEGRSPEEATRIAFELLVRWASDGLIAG